jgi:transposase
VLAAIVFVASTGCTWRQLPPVFGASWQTVHRRFSEWTAAEVWPRLQLAALDAPGDLGTDSDADWSRQAIDAVGARARTAAAEAAEVPEAFGDSPNATPSQRDSSR